MAANENVSQQHPRCNPVPIIPQHGIVTLFGYNSSASVDRGHLILNDGIGMQRRQGRFPRVRHGLKRLIVIGSAGMVTFEALRWLADQDAAFVMLERDGRVLATTGPVRPSDARLRRAQSVALHSSVAIEIATELIRQKLSGQETVGRDDLNDSRAGQLIASARAALKDATSMESIRYLEAQAGHAYWSAWHSVQVAFPRADLHRVPDHWRTFGARMSPLSGSPRLAVNPLNASLNYLYALLESEARLAIAALGLDPGLGFLHFDSRTRDSLACDLMEPVRPQIDAYLLQWLRREALRREWFFEERNGNCRLMATFAARLAETAPNWGRAVAPLAEWVARTLWKSTHKPTRRSGPATRLTQHHRRQAKGGTSEPRVSLPPRPPSICRACGVTIKYGKSYCPTCVVTVSREGLIEAAKLGRIAGHSPEARARQAEKQRQHAAAVKSWHPSGKPEWLTEQVFREQIQPLLAAITVPAISSALGVSEPYASLIRAKRYLPHPRHWMALLRLTGYTPSKHW
jgi:CRISPR-associated endonuclease Cas1